MEMEMEDVNKNKTQQLTPQKIQRKMVYKKGPQRQ